MRYLVLLTSLLAFACGGGDSTGPSTNGTVVFVLDGQTCAAGSYPLEFFVNGVSKGTFTVSPGDAGHSFSVQQGQFNVSARLVGSDFTWGPRSISLTAGDTFTYTLTC